jgi:hypothetical protein
MLQNIIAGIADFLQNIQNISVKRIFFHGNIAHSHATRRNPGNCPVIIVFEQNIIVQIPEAFLAGSALSLRLGHAGMRLLYRLRPGSRRLRSRIRHRRGRIGLRFRLRRLLLSRSLRINRILFRQIIWFHISSLTVFSI